jgi:hypothetical protein
VGSDFVLYYLMIIIENTQTQYKHVHAYKIIALCGDRIRDFLQSWIAPYL